MRKMFVYAMRVLKLSKFFIGLSDKEKRTVIKRLRFPFVYGILSSDIEEVLENVKKN
ncbi:MAG: hypothetical protein WC444_04755 [Candidatus Paceibacterota bacterium]